jgi:hypothetical protein
MGRTTQVRLHQRRFVRGLMIVHQVYGRASRNDTGGRALKTTHAAPGRGFN